MEPITGIKAEASQADSHRDGFTLTELLIAITVLGALAAIGLPVFSGYRNQQNVARAVNDLRVLDNRLQSYKMNNDEYPPALADVPQGNLNDPWGRPYRYLRIEGETKVKVSWHPSGPHVGRAEQ